MGPNEGWYIQFLHMLFEDSLAKGDFETAQKAANRLLELGDEP